MFSVWCVLRCALFASQARLQKSGSFQFTLNSSTETQSNSLTESASQPDDLDRAAAIERLSDEVFGCGNKHLKNVETLSALPEGLHSFPEVCFIGKPNCGKSSLISCLLHNARLGKAGATGGTTRLLQFFNVGDGLLLVDTPGYGGWRGRQLSQALAERANAFSILFRYLALRKDSNLKRVYWLMEASARSPVSFQERDEEILCFLAREKIPFSVILTKIDRHWRQYAEEQRTTALVGRDGLVHPGHLVPERGAGPRIQLPEEGVARNVQEVFNFLGTDKVPVLGVSADRKKPGRSRNLDLLQHDIVHYCTQDLLPGEPLTLTNLRKLSYAPPTADSIQDVQLRYPIEAFVVPQNNNLSLKRMVETHEQMKAQFLMRNVDAARLTAKDVSLCHLGSVAEAAETVQVEDAARTQLGEVIPSTAFLYDAASGPTETLAEKSSSLPLRLTATTTDSEVCEDGRSIVGMRDTESGADAAGAKAQGGVRHLARSFRTRPSLSAKESAAAALGNSWQVVHNASLEPECQSSAADDDCGDLQDSEKGPDNLHASTSLVLHDVLPNSSSDCEPGPPGFNLAPVSISARRSVLLRERTPSSPALPVMLSPDAQYVTAIDGTRIPRSMISVSVEQLAMQKEDELTHFATKSGAGAYEELLLLDHENNTNAADPFTEASDVARLPEAVQTELLDARQYRTRSAARKQEERLLDKYVARKRKERSISLQAEGYMCPWLGVPEKREVVRGLSASHSFGKGGAVMRDLKQSGFGGKSYSARTMKNRGRATKKTGFWAA